MQASETKGFFSRFSHVLNLLYMNSPVNGSSWTGFRYPHLPHLWGDWREGRLPFVKGDPDGEGLFKNYKEAVELAQNHPSGMCYFWIRGNLTLVITRPDQVQQVFVQNRYLDRRLPYASNRDFWGPDLTTDVNKVWREKRRLFDHGLKTGTTKSWHTVFEANTQCMVERLKARKGQSIDVEELVMKLIQQNVLKTLFGFMDISAENETELLAYIKFLNKEVFSFAAAATSGTFEQTPEKQAVKERVRAKFKKMLVDLNPNLFKDENSIAYKLWNRNYPSADEFLDTHLDSVLGDLHVLFLGAQDTPASALIFIIKMLAARPDLQNALFQALTLLECEEGTVTWYQIKTCKYLDAIINETLRLYPPVSFLSRGVDQPCQIDDIPLAKGDLILTPFYFINRSKALWGEDAEEFKPERFMELSDSDVLSGKFFPFGLGETICPGKAIAMEFLKLGLAALVFNFKIEIPDNNMEATFVGSAIKPKYPTIANFIVREVRNELTEVSLSSCSSFTCSSSAC